MGALVKNPAGVWMHFVCETEDEGRGFRIPKWGCEEAYIALCSIMKEEHWVPNEKAGKCKRSYHTTERQFCMKFVGRGRYH